MMKAISLILLLSCMIFSSCDRAKALYPIEEITGNENLETTDYQFHQDGKGGLFNNVKWYTYNMNTHGIYSNLDVYTLKSEGEYYLLQIYGYYDPNNDELAGHYSLKIQNQSGIHYITLDASGCGNVYTNPDYYPCLGDPQKNAFTYLNLETLETRVLSDDVGAKDLNWHIAFKSTDVLLNSGLSGEGDVVGGLLYRNENLYSGSTIDLDLLLSEISDRGWDQYFSLKTEDEIKATSFFPQDGIDRVFYEDFWWQADGDNSRLKTAVTENWFVLKSYVANQFFKIHVSDISHYELEGEEVSSLTFEYFLQSAEESSFSTELKTLTIDPLHYDTKFVTLCISLADETIGECVENRWDLKLVIANMSETNSIWRLFVGAGAYGPLSLEQMENITSQN